MNDWDERNRHCSEKTTSKRKKTPIVIEANNPMHIMDF